MHRWHGAGRGRGSSSARASSAWAEPAAGGAHNPRACIRPAPPAASLSGARRRLGSSSCPSPTSNSAPEASCRRRPAHARVATNTGRAAHAGRRRGVHREHPRAFRMRTTWSFTSISPSEPSVHQRHLRPEGTSSVSVLYVAFSVPSTIGNGAGGAVDALHRAPVARQREPPSRFVRHDADRVNGAAPPGPCMSPSGSPMPPGGPWRPGLRRAGRRACFALEDLRRARALRNGSRRSPALRSWPDAAASAPIGFQRNLLLCGFEQDRQKLDLPASSGEAVRRTCSAGKSCVGARVAVRGRGSATARAAADRVL